MDDPSLGETRNDRLAPPCPEAGDNAEIQFTLLAAFHVHSGCVVIASDPVPPSAPIIGGEASDTTHFTGFGPVLTVADVSQLETSVAAMTTRTAGFTASPAEQDAFQRLQFRLVCTLSACITEGRANHLTRDDELDSSVLLTAFSRVVGGDRKARPVTLRRDAVL